MVQEYQYANGAYPICNDCQVKLDDAKKETLATD